MCWWKVALQSTLCCTPHVESIGKLSKIWSRPIWYSGTSAEIFCRVEEDLNVEFTIDKVVSADWWGRGPIFREVGVNLIGGTSMLAIQLLITHDSKSCNCYTAAPLVINQPQLNWPRQENFSCKRIGEHKQERVNTKSEMTDVYEAKTKMGFKLWS